MWSLFSISSVTATDIVEDHFFTQLVGSGLYIGYHVTSIIVLLNMLIAMMSHSFQTINVRTIALIYFETVPISCHIFDY